MIIQSTGRHSIAIGLVLAVAAATFAQPSAAQPAAGAAQQDPKQQVQQQVAEFLLSSISPGSEVARYTDVMDAITRAQNSDGAGAQALLEKAAKGNPKLPPAEVMIAR